jgi:hypothetical protein
MLELLDYVDPAPADSTIGWLPDMALEVDGMRDVVVLAEGIGPPSHRGTWAAGRCVPDRRRGRAADRTAAMVSLDGRDAFRKVTSRSGVRPQEVVSSERTRFSTA